MESKIKYWIDISDYDLETAEAMLQSKRYLYVGFMCHQTIEKAFKAYFIKVKLKRLLIHIVCHYLQKEVIFMILFQKYRKNLSTRLSH
jgi:HEPN domain-containing protein